MHLLFEFLQVRQCSPDDKPTQTVPDEREPAQLLARAAFPHEVVHFLRQTVAHVCDAALGVLLVG